MPTYRETGKMLAVCPNCGKRVEGRQLVSTHGPPSIIKLVVAFFTAFISLLFTGFRSLKTTYFKCPSCRVVSEVRQSRIP